MKHLRKYYEKLTSDIYKSAADKLSKMGHVERPKALMQWHNLIKQREMDAKKKIVLDDSKQLGIYTFKINITSQRYKSEFTGDFYIHLVWDKWEMDEDGRYTDWKAGNEQYLWTRFSLAVIPATPESLEYCENYIKPLMGSSEWGYYWVGELWINLSKNDYDDVGDRKLKPEGKMYYEAYEFSIHLANRKSAIQFKKAIFEVLNGDIVYGEKENLPGGVKEDIIELLCNEYGHDLDEYLDVVDSILKVSINKLYKD